MRSTKNIFFIFVLFPICTPKNFYCAETCKRYRYAEVASATKVIPPVIHIIQSYEYNDDDNENKNKHQHFYVALSPNKEKMAFVTEEGCVCIYNLKNTKKQYCDLSALRTSTSPNIKSLVFRTNSELALLAGPQLIFMRESEDCLAHGCNICKHNWFVWGNIHDAKNPVLERGEFLTRENGHLMFHARISGRDAVLQFADPNRFVPIGFCDNIVKPKQKQIVNNGQKENCPLPTIQLPSPELSFMRIGDIVEISNDDDAIVECIANKGLRRIKKEQLLKRAVASSIFLLATKAAVAKVFHEKKFFYN